MKTIRLFFLFVLIALTGNPSHANTISIGAVGNSTNTGYYLKADGNMTTTGEIWVGTFSISQAQIVSLISAWGSSVPTYSRYTNLVSYFTEIGTGGLNGSVVPGWTFDTNGAVSGTSTGVDSSIISSGNQLYVWSFTMTNFASQNFNSGSQWGLFTGETNWIAPASGTKSLNLAQVDSSGVLIGTDLSPTFNSVEMIAAVPEPPTEILLAVSLIALWGLIRVQGKLRQSSEVK